MWQYSSEQALQLPQIPGNLLLQRLQPGDDNFRLLVLHLVVDDFAIAVQRKIVLVGDDLLLRNVKSLFGAVPVLLCIERLPPLADVRQVVLGYREPFVVEAEAVGLNVVEEDVGRHASLGEDKDGRRNPGVWFEYSSRQLDDTLQLVVLDQDLPQGDVGRRRAEEDAVG